MVYIICMPSDRDGLSALFSEENRHYNGQSKLSWLTISYLMIPSRCTFKAGCPGSCRDFASKVNDHIVQFRRNDIEELTRRKADLRYRGYDVDSYLLDCHCPRFGTGEAKGVINESVRGNDVFVMVDVMNYSITLYAATPTTCLRMTIIRI